jgi:hypothetical protein
MAAIYQWFDTTIYVTTTLYPVEAFDGIDISVTIDSGSMTALPGEGIDVAHDLISGTYTQLRWFYTDGPYTDGLDVTHDLVAGTYTQLRWFYTDGPYNEGIDVTHDLVAGSYDQVLIEADSPDEGLDLSIAIETSSSMTGV